MTEEDVIDAWMSAGEERWFAKDAAFDGMLSVRFKSALADARNGAFDHWAKTPRGVGLGDAYRLTTEFVLYARRGSLRERRTIETTWFNWPRGRHSEKPDEFYEMVEAVNHSPFLEMFARSARRGWTPWGHEAPEVAA